MVLFYFFVCLVGLVIFELYMFFRGDFGCIFNRVLDNWMGGDGDCGGGGVDEIISIVEL